MSLLSVASSQIIEVKALLRLDSIKLGAVAQLGERLLCKQDVAGSIPVSSKLDAVG